MDILALAIGLVLCWFATSYFGPPARAQKPVEPAREEEPKPPDTAGDCFFYAVIAFLIFG